MKLIRRREIENRKGLERIVESACQIAYLGLAAWQRQQVV
ncbi:MAG: hypothetical protein BWX67_02176 [Thermotogae bacterium ADurb.Bin062]|jgi:hypothetical protein|nr:MAG: hypothetical protein BWX67_02176 [Thermotogota bacterium ADurb.Bin062]